MGDRAPAHQPNLDLPGEPVSVRLPAELEHLQRLADGMAPDPREWAYTGEVQDAKGAGARCVCGHPIRWIFVIRRDRDGATLPIGSTCIETSIPYLVTHGAEGLADRLQEAVRELRREVQRRAAAAKREAREAENEETIARLCDDWERLAWWRKQARDEWYAEHGPSYPYALCLRPPIPAPCKTTAGTIRRLVREYRRAVAAIEADPERGRLPALPHPDSPELQEDA